MMWVAICLMHEQKSMTKNHFKFETTQCHNVSAGLRPLGIIHDQYRRTQDQTDFHAIFELRESDFGSGR